jgi:hypothetical protein
LERKILILVIGKRVEHLRDLLRDIVKLVGVISVMGVGVVHEVAVPAITEWQHVIIVIYVKCLRFNILKYHLLSFFMLFDFLIDKTVYFIEFYRIMAVII